MPTSIFRGIGFPFRKEGVELPVPATDDDLIAQDLLRLIQTSKGERLMRPDFGTNATSYVFSNNDATLEENLRADLMGAIGRYESRVVITNIRAIRSDSTITLTIEYVVKATQQQNSLSLALPSL